METLRERALRVLLERNPDQKALMALDSTDGLNVGSSADFEEPIGIPGRPDRPELVPPTSIKSRSVRSKEGHAGLIHALAHIELNAIDLACDLTFRFAGMPDEFYLDWMNVAKEEALHFRLLRDHLHTLGYQYGSFPAHNSLWEMAERTKHDILARISLVPRTMEARGLDASPPIKAKLVSIGDTVGAEVLDVILRDEICHVSVGNKWYGYLCKLRGLEPVSTYSDLAEKYRAPRPRGPFNIEARKAAGFTDDELKALG
jgi:uncharacterized ferritin-like protein (DUF455 family)